MCYAAVRRRLPTACPEAVDRLAFAPRGLSCPAEAARFPDGQNQGTAPATMIQPANHIHRIIGFSTRVS